VRLLTDPAQHEARPLPTSYQSVTEACSIRRAAAVVGPGAYGPLLLVVDAGGG
jgi:hypothetical protein